MILLLLAACTPDPLDSAEPGEDPFADAVVSFAPGPAAGFGADAMPDVVLGRPHGAGGEAGSLDVVSLGQGGELVLQLTDIGLADGPGPDLLVFENPFADFVETGIVGVSDDGEAWEEWPCDTDTLQGCAGVEPVFANPENALDPTDPEQAGGDAFDLADLGLSHARFVRVRDTGDNEYLGTSGGFDLDAIAVIGGEPLR